MTPAMALEDVSVYAGAAALVEGVSLSIPDRRVTAIIGPSGSGKTTLLRCLNRLGEQCDQLRVAGGRELFGEELTRLDVNLLRQRVGMVFQKPCVFPGSIHKNVVFGLRHLGLCRYSDEREVVERELRRVGLYDEVIRRLDEPASELSVGQQQRLCLARALASAPQVLLLDEPTSALDPISVQRIEELVSELRDQCALVLVTHSLSQACRLADQVAFMSGGKLLEVAPAERFFKSAQHHEARRFLETDAG
jgi:phosphate transport system ATP-binding protein